MDDYRRMFGEEVRRARIAAGLTQEEMSLRCGLQRTHIARIESGRYDVRLDTMAKIADSLGGCLSLRFEKKD
jgi:transcriptional regulator with XRE-family HTH domain